MIIPEKLLDFDQHPVTTEMVAGTVNHNDCTGGHFNKAWFRLKEISPC